MQVQNTNCYAIRFRLNADALRTEVCFHKVNAVAKRVIECGTGWLAHRGYAPNLRQGRLRSNEHYWETRFGVWCPIIAFPRASHGAIDRYALRASVMGDRRCCKKSKPPFRGGLLCCLINVCYELQVMQPSSMLHVGPVNSVVMSSMSFDASFEA